MNSPRGYDKEIVIDPTNVSLEKITCSHCKLLLRNPVQNICGHRYCKDCVFFIITSSSVKPIRCQECLKEEQEDNEDTILNEENIVPDHRARREMLKMQVRCINQGCSWIDEFKNYEEHRSTCSKPKYKAAHEQSIFGQGATAGSCPWKCTITDKTQSLDDHLKEKHLEHLISTFHISKTNENSCTELIKHVKALEDEQKVDKESLAFIREQLGKMQQQNATVHRLVLQREQQLKMNQEQSLYSLPHHSFSRGQFGSSDLQTQQTIATLESKFKEVEKRQLELEKKFESKQQVMNSQQALQAITIRELQIRLKGLETTSYDGKLIWRITGFNQKRKDAREGRVSSVYSPCFFTSRAGYKMCLRLYLNGDGGGRGSHISLFFLLMRGLYDAKLPWPFKQKVELKLLDVEALFNYTVADKTIIDSFVPDTTSSSFSKPATDMNIATGFPKFMPQKQFDENLEHFVKDDSLFVMASVSTEGLD